ncbi:MAG: transposase [Terriglobales bacterium]
METRTFFVTAVTWQRRLILQSDALARELISALYDYRAADRFALHEFVIMPDHVHLLLTPAPTLTLERAMQFIKGGFSYRVGKTRPNLMVWEKSFTNHRIRDERDYQQHREYIHQNPVRRHLAQDASEFPYSSAHAGFELDPSPFAMGIRVLVARASIRDQT